MFGARRMFRDLLAFPRAQLQRLKWQATGWPAATSTKGGSTSAQMLSARQQRVRNRHPLGGSVGVGGSPTRTIRARSRSISGSGIGAADSNAFVYGCAGRLYSSETGATSTILPRYITATRWLRWRTTERSWAMNR